VLRSGLVDLSLLCDDLHFENDDSGFESNVLLLGGGDDGGKFGLGLLEFGGIGFLGVVADGKFVPEVGLELSN